MAVPWSRAGSPSCQSSSELKKANDEHLDSAYLLWIEGQPVFAKNLETAKSFLQVNITPERVSGLLNGIDFTKPVEVTKLEPGHPLQRHEAVPTEAKPRKEQADGCWFAEVGTAQEKLGMIDATTQKPHVEREQDLFVVRGQTDS